MEPRYLTTPEAAAYCRFKTPRSLLAAEYRGEIKSAGRRGLPPPHGRKDLRVKMWAIVDLDAYLTTPATSEPQPRPPNRRDIPRTRRGREDPPAMSPNDYQEALRRIAGRIAKDCVSEPTQGRATRRRRATEP